MKVGVLGTGSVGRAIATRLIEVGHEVRMGSRTADNETAAGWAAEAGENASAGDFADAAAFGDFVFHATSGRTALRSLEMAGAENLENKILIDVSNPLDMSTVPPSLLVANTDSLAEQIQAAFPGAKVVKTLNTVNADVMVHPELVPGAHTIFVSGDDETAKVAVTAVLGEFGWPGECVRDLGDIASARGPEAYLLLWIGLRMTSSHSRFNVAVVVGNG